MYQYPPEGSCQAQQTLALARVLEPVECCSDVVSVAFEPVEPLPGNNRAQVRLGLLRECQEVLGVPSAQLVGVA